MASVYMHFALARPERATGGGGGAVWSEPVRMEGGVTAVRYLSQPDPAEVRREEEGRKGSIGQWMSPLPTTHHSLLLPPPSSHPLSRTITLPSSPPTLDRLSRHHRQRQQQWQRCTSHCPSPWPATHHSSRRE